MMKLCKGRRIKGLALLGLLVLCLALTGCIVPPDDIGANSGYQVSNNDLPFQSMAPTITDSPSPPPTDVPTPTPTFTPNPFAQQPTATPTVNLGNIGVNNQGGQSLPNITPQIIVTTSSAPVSSNVLKNGSTGDDVRRMQNRLKELGYLKGSADGDFGDATETAVKNFQANHGLTVDGVAGSATLNKLYSDSAKKAASVTATNTPRPTNTPFTSLKNGSTGEDVRRMQQRLRELGYLKSVADGDFGDATEAAVKAFQRDQGLTADGKAGTVTLNKLYSDSAKKVTAAPTATPTATPFTSLQHGATGDEVTRLQNRLKELGYYKSVCDGEFGSATETAVRAFQRRNGLTDDGKAGTATLNRLYSDSARRADSPTEAPTSTPFTSLQNGDSGDEVRKMQKRLKELGYYDRVADGSFGDVTEAALKAFQKNNGLTADGKAGSTTLNRLYSDSAKPAGSEATKTPNPESLDFYLELGNSGTKVRTLQNRLIELGWLAGTADGSYGNATEYAVKAFQGRYDSLWKDGVIGPDTLKVLYGANAATSKTPAASLGISLEPGDDGSAVKAMQNRLKELGFYKSTSDGDYGDVTKAAVIAFQTANGLTANGSASKATLDRLYSASAKNSDYLKDQENAEDEEDEAVKPDDEPIREQEPEDVDDVVVGGYTTLRWGAKGEAVKKLQQALKNRGYYSGTIDSTFGSGVYAAVKAFQKQYGLKVDGVAGPATQILLYGASASSADTSATLKKGSSGTAVRNLQYVLYELGYYDGKITGEYGDTTADAVRAFQINNDMSTVDGVAGPKTLKVIYSGNAVAASSTEGKYELLESGDSGTLVVELQETLYKLGYLSEVTGEYDSATVEAVKNLQRRNGLTVNGKADQKLQRLIYFGEPTPAW